MLGERGGGIHNTADKFTESQASSIYTAEEARPAAKCQIRFNDESASSFSTPTRIPNRLGVVVMLARWNEQRGRKRSKDTLVGMFHRYLMDGLIYTLR